MDRLIFELKFLRKIMLAPCNDERDKMDLFSRYMETELNGMDINMYHNKRRDIFARAFTTCKLFVVLQCVHDVTCLFYQLEKQKEDITITDDEMNELIGLLTFYLTHFKSCESINLPKNRRKCVEVLSMVLLIVLQSNKKDECQSWIKEFMPDLKSLRNVYGDTMLHDVIGKCEGVSRCFPILPLVQMLVEEGKMDVNVENNAGRTPLHLLSGVVANVTWMAQEVSEDIKSVAELLINNGAHMDSVDERGREASAGLAKAFPQFSFNANLKCLAAKALIKHGVNLERFKPATLVPFIQSHIPRRGKPVQRK